MGKKLKNLDGVIPCDVFEKLLLESHQIATVVLMLDSPEDDVVIRAGCALFQFSEKCDENKVTLLELNAIDKLVRLLQNDERKIRRFAAMIIGSMSQHADVRKALRKREETVPLLIRLLLWEDDSVVQEYVTLCMSSLAVDYSCKHHLCYYGAMEPLIQCIQLTDPDIQKNSIQTIALMLQDYPSRKCLRDANGFEPILNLLKSEYPVIQYHALMSLQLAAEDGENRCILRDLKIARILMDYLIIPETSELHVFAIMVLVNCFESQGILKDFRDYGGLQRLLQFITEVQIIPEEEKKPKKEKSPSKPGAGKKSRAVADEAERQKSKGAVDPGITVMPDIKEQVAKAIMLAARNPDNLKMLHEQDTENKLMHLLVGDRGPALQAAAILALGTMSDYPVIRENIVKHDGLDLLAKFGKTDNAELIEALSLAYANFTKDNPAICSEMLNRGIVDQLLSMITNPRETTVVCSVMALSNIANDELSRSELIGRGIISTLVELLHSKSCLVQTKTLMSLASFLVDSEAEKQMMEASCIELLLSMFDSSDESVIQAASWVIFVMAANETIAADICSKGGLAVLRRIQCSTSRRNPFSELALRKLFDHQLSAKYAFTGIIDSDNLIGDFFYDTGRLREDGQLKTVEEYGSEPINDKRPILLVNPRPQIVVVETPSVHEVPVVHEVVEKVSKTALGVGNLTKSVREPRKKSHREKDEREKEKDKEKQKEGEMHIQQQQQQQHQQQQQLQMTKSEANVNVVKEPYVVPGDNRLLQYITEVQEHIAVLPNSLEQICALARFVSDKMGGVFDYGCPTICDLYEAENCLKMELDSNVIPIGMIKTGVYYHRALLFKILSDRIGIPCSLVRGDYNRAWNVVMISEEILQLGLLSEQLQPYIVDLIHQPGNLLRLGSCEAVPYQRLII